MPFEKIHIIGSEEIVLLFGLLGIDGTIIENTQDFHRIFNELIKNKSIGMIIISLNLSQKEINEIMEYKLNIIRPFVYVLPDIFKEDIDESDKFLQTILNSIKQLIS
ncbi:MAG: V-type ATP synthase subunit F [Promethearchaeia archaeon]